MNRLQLAEFGALALLLSSICGGAEETPHVTPEQVERAVQGIDTLLAKNLQDNTRFGLCHCGCLSGQSSLGKGFRVRDVNSKLAVITGKRLRRPQPR